MRSCFSVISFTDFFSFLLFCTFIKIQNIALHYKLLLLFRKKFMISFTLLFCRRNYYYEILLKNTIRWLLMTEFLGKPHYVHYCFLPGKFFFHFSIISSCCWTLFFTQINERFSLLHKELKNIIFHLTSSHSSS